MAALLGKPAVAPKLGKPAVVLRKEVAAMDKQFNWQAASVSWPIGFNLERRLTRKSAPSGGLRLPLAVGLLLLVGTTALAHEPGSAPLREIFVPFEDLNIILEGPTQRVFLTREEYDALIAKAKTKPLAHVPHKVALVAAEYDATLEEGRAIITGQLTIEVLDDGLFPLPLDLAGVGIRSAILDDKPAPLVRGPLAPRAESHLAERDDHTGDEHQRPVVLLEGKGLHKLTLSLTAPLSTAAAQQSLNVTLPTTTAARLKLAVPGNVEVKGGAAVIDRQYDKEANLTRLELLPQRGGMSLVMSLNNRLLQAERVVVARSVLVDEVTQGYERIHATVSHRVLHGAVDKLRFAVPAGFEVTRAESPLLARWETKQEGDAKVLELTLREPTTEQIVVEISANRSPKADADWLASLANWKFPALVPLDVEGQVAVLGLLVEDRLRPENIAATNLLPIDADVLAGAIPASVLNAEPGAPDVRQVVTYYAPSAQYDLTARFARPPAGLKVATNSLLIIADKGLTLTGGFALTPEAENLFDFRFTIPAGWQVTQVTRADGTPLSIERYATADGGTRVLVRLPGGVAAGQTATVNFELLHTPKGWLADWENQTIDYPRLAVEGATADTGAVAAQTLDDLVVRPDKLEGLTPLLDAEKAKFGLADLPTALAYRYPARPFSASLRVERTRPSLVAQVYSFFRIEPDNLIAHYELNYDVREARTRRVSFLLPKETPAEISIKGLKGTVVKEFRSSDEGAQRRWEVQLADRKIGSVRLAIDFEQRHDPLALKQFGLPLVTAADVEYQSAFVSVEGDEELDITLTTAARPVDVGELSGAEYGVGRRVIGAYGYVGDAASVSVSAVRRDPYALPPALVQKARLTTRLAVSGRSQSLADFDLVTKATLLEVRLPAGSTLWTIALDEQPTKPQKEGESLLISLPAQEKLAVRTLRVVYETTGAGLSLAGQIEAIAPQLLVRAKGVDAERAVPQADLDWTLQLPSGYTLRRSDGTVYTTAIEQRQPAALKVAAVLYTLAGGFDPWYSAREQARRSQSSNDMRQWGLATQNYGDYVEQAKTAAAPVTREAAPMEGARPGMDPLAPMAEDKPNEAVPPTTAQPEAMPPPSPEPARPASRDQVDQTAQHQDQQQKEERDIESATPANRNGRMLLTGVSSLRINMRADGGGQAITFTSLGSNPQLRASLIDNRRLHAAAWGLGLLVALVGVGLTFRPARYQAAFVVIMLLAASLPLLVTDKFDEVADVFDAVFYAACALAVYYPLAALAISLGRWIQARTVGSSPFAPQAKAAVVASVLFAVAALSLTPRDASAQEPAGVRIVNLRDILPLVDDTPGPVTVPTDAVVVPYDPEKPEERGPGQKLLVPYDKYVELYNRANPDKKIVTQALPADFALAGATYQATLAAADSLAVRGTIEIEVFSDKPVAVPMTLGGGVLVKATVDGASAKLQVVEPNATAPNAPAEKTAKQPAHQQAANPAPNAADSLPPRMLLLHLSGKGRKKLELTIHLGLTRQGGWRIVHGQLPVGPAAALTLVAPTAGTEIRHTSLADKPNFETKADNEEIATSLTASGQLDLQWRAKVSEGQVDQSLTARSIAALDVREDALRLVWQVKLEFGRAFRDAFTFAVPADFLVEQVTGENVRGWSAKKVGGEGSAEQTLDVTLLKPAQGTETITIQLAKRGRVGQGELAEFNAPTVVVIDAALQQGEIAVRKSPRLDLRTVTASGLSRADADGQTAAVEQLSDASDAAVLVVKPYQTFRFVRMPVTLRLAAAELAQATTAEVRAALRVAERDTTLDAAVVYRAAGQPIYKAELYLPQGFELDRLGPAGLEWAITSENNRKKLTVQLLDGRTGEFQLTLFGRIVGVGDPPSPDGEPKTRTIPAPVIEVIGVSKQEGDFVVLPDPDTDVRLENIQNADNVLLMQAIGWLAPEQQPLAKGALRFRAPNYAANLVLTPRTPQVSARTITNVKVTPRAIEETILLNFQIDQAGIRRLSFYLPEALAKARLNVKLLKSKTVEPATDSQGQLIPGWVRFRLELQDYVRGEFGVVVMHDRLLTTAPQSVAIPRVETGRTEQRLVAIENAGRDEIDTEGGVAGLEKLSPQQQTYRELAAVLGGTITEAYAVANENVVGASPSLTFKIKERAAAETAAARIGLATTVLVVDQAGAYRGLQEYRVTNATEQFLEIQLPAGSRLWTATVAGQPVKPVVASGAGFQPAIAGGAGLQPAVASGAGFQPADPSVVRIPLVKTAEGEGDYPVQLKYGGQMPKVASFSQVRFPLMRTVNINVERSQVRLHLPENYDWASYFDFGGSMRPVEDESELGAMFQLYLSDRIQEAKELLTSANPFTRIRAMSNLKQSALLLDSSRSMSQNNLKGLGATLQGRNDELLREAEQQVQQQQAGQQAAVADNRDRLNTYWESQGVNRSKNVVSGLASNFDGQQDGAEGKGNDAYFNPQWLDQNKLGTKGEAAESPNGKAAADPKAGDKPGGRYSRGGGKNYADDFSKPQSSGGEQGQGKGQGEGELPELANDQQRAQLQRDLQKEADERASAAELSRGEDEVTNLWRYGQNLDFNAQQQEFGGLASQQPNQPPVPGQPMAPGASPASGSGQAARGMMGGFGGPGGGGILAGAQSGQAGAPLNAPATDPSTVTAATPAPAPVVVTGDTYANVAAGLASLDFRLPERGRVYSFTTQRGLIDVTARPVAHSLISRLMGLAALIAAVLVVSVASRKPAREAYARLLGTVSCGVLLAVLGLVSLVTGIFPYLGLVLIVAGIVLAIRNRSLSLPAAAAN
jgi:hypothetical protein